MLILLDVLSVIVAYGFALLLRFDFMYSFILADSVHHIPNYLRSMPIWCGVTVAVFFLFRLYHSIWAQASLAELTRIIWAYVVLFPCYILIILKLDLNMPKAYYIVGFLLSAGLPTAIRFAFRLTRYMSHHALRRSTNGVEQIMVIGAGSTGQMIIREFQNSDRVNSHVCCIIDDDPEKQGKRIEGVEIVGNRHDIVNMAKKYGVTRIVYAIPSNTPEERSAILNLCKETNCRLQTIPGMYQLLNDEVSVSRLRDVEVADLLGISQSYISRLEKKNRSALMLCMNFCIKSI